MRIAGIDGCKAGWIAVVAEEGRPETAAPRPVARVADLFAVTDVAFALVDIPIGFVDGPEPRDTEAAMRAFLKGKASSVFNTPCRAALIEEVYFDASYVNREKLGIGLSKQSFMLFPKMLEVDRFAERDCQTRLREGHPEVSFAEMNGRLPVLSRKRQPDGRADRIALLAAQGFDAEALAGQANANGCAVDDMLDATALLWSAMRFRREQHTTFPAQPQRDARGLEMSVIA
ncbi:DUF429 domain-containing protein [Frigidibacter sp. MR17.24]|uniref:DUF429 domain-containing protein n=1 Tax=Frigidibacter sp. MR17.24 TaxID=3127345 RepID=UPI003012B092